MTWTYASSAPGATSKDWVRLRIGDTSSGDQLLQDEEIAAWLASFGSKELAAANACESIAAKYARRVDSGTGDVSNKWSQFATRYLELAAALRQEAAVGGPGVAPWAASVSVAEKEAQVEDSDRVAPAFSRDMFDTVTLGSQEAVLGSTD